MLYKTEKQKGMELNWSYGMVVMAVVGTQNYMSDQGKDNQKFTKITVYQRWVCGAF